MVLHRLPQDLYQTAKISKLLLLMEKGADKYKGKSLNEIDVNPETEFAEEENSDKEDDNVNHSRGNVIEYLQGKYVILNICNKGNSNIECGI